ncbi:OLC1v1021291C1 [Oldenlandia corymbosa var. corymbosa]|uniref:OLC1v1021291C1 n=1 Tax=Oldenlandia corymbosa var. corymbosa TaxID=529605 RepID=A0AAV1BVX4_OLDCO|nr:OLC1v1021291C1 [Oldenlandia corymbosa var. corymbosa]
MESKEVFSLTNTDAPDVLSSVTRYNHEDIIGQNYQSASNTTPAIFPSNSKGIEGAASGKQKTPDPSLPQRMHFVSISMPPSPGQNHYANSTKVFPNDNANSAATSGYVSPPELNTHESPVTSRASRSCIELPMIRNSEIQRLKDKRFDVFKTRSGELERQLSNLRGKHQEGAQLTNPPQNIQAESFPVHRYFDALQGPELDTLRPSEQILLPEDKLWPFLLRYPVSSFSICIGLGSQAFMWKALAISSSTKFLHISLHVNLILWCISIALLVIVSSIYSMKLVFYFEAVRREFLHPVRVNFFFAPWVAILFLVLGLPPSVSHGDLPEFIWYFLMTPIICLELKIYGQWVSGGQRRLSKVANPSNHLSIVGNFVGALLGASMGLKEGPIFFFAVGLAHYIVLFVTLYQRLPTNETLPKELHPVFFLFVTAPSVASMAWAKIHGSFDFGSRIAYFIALFLYISLAVRINFFRGFRFSLSWWAYTFPMTGAAIATISYSNVVTNIITKCLTVALCAIATLIVAALLIRTIVHAFVLKDLFPNDIAIAISERRAKTNYGWFLRRLGSSDTKEIESYLKYVNSDQRDIEASVTGTFSVAKKV